MNYSQLKTGEIKFIWSDNVEEKTMSLFSKDIGCGYDIECDITEKYSYADIKKMRCEYI